MAGDGEFVKGRGAGGALSNRFLQRQYGAVHPEGIDEPEELDRPTRVVEVFPKSILNRVNSPDIPFTWSLNPYQGCEHGCSYCYARPTHEYWGYDAALDFEQVVLVKRNAPELLERTLRKRGWQVDPIMLSGATDPYQPVERKERITRRLLEVFLAFGHPVRLITKNALVLRDLDLLSELASRRLASVALSITTLDEDLRRVLEPRTSTAAHRLRAVHELSAAGVPVHVMVAPIIPGLTDAGVPAVLKAAAEAGARSAGYTMLRTNGAVGEVFRRWLQDHLPDRASKVMAQTAHAHGGRMNDSRFGRRMRGEGAHADAIARMFTVFRERHFSGRSMPPLAMDQFRPPPEGQLELF